MEEMLTLHLYLAGMDEVTNGVKLIVELKALHPSGHFFYNADNIWFKRDAIRKFVADIDDWLNHDECVIKDFSNYFIIKIRKDGYDNIINVTVHEPIYGAEQEARLTISVRTGYEQLIHLREVFRSFC